MDPLVRFTSTEDSPPGVVVAPRLRAHCLPAGALAVAIWPGHPPRPPPATPTKAPDTTPQHPPNERGGQRGSCTMRRPPPWARPAKSGSLYANPLTLPASGRPAVRSPCGRPARSAAGVGKGGSTGSEAAAAFFTGCAAATVASLLRACCRAASAAASANSGASAIGAMARLSVALGSPKSVPHER